MIPRSLFRSSRISLAFVTAAACMVPTWARAAVVDVGFTDSSGAALADGVALLESTTGKAAVKPMADAEISQSARQFHPRVTLVTTGTRISFPNFDTVRHHVYSFSAAKTFELKLYAGVPAVPVMFDKPGIAVLGCNIHDSMAAWVVIADTPWSARSGANGHARIEAVPPGSYRLRYWHPGLPPNTEPPTLAVTVAAADQDIAAHLPFKAEP